MNRIKAPSVINQNGMSLRRRIWNARGLYLLLFFPLVYKIIFNYIPMYGVVIAFKDFSLRKGILGSLWADPWYKHWARYISSPYFFQTIKNTLILTLYSMVVGFPLPIALALLLNYMPSKKLKKTVQMVSFAPYFLSTVLVIGIVSLIFNPETGLINNMITLMGGDKINFLAERSFFRHIYVWSGQWQGMGYSSIIYISALAGVDPGMHEAAIIDGATIPQRIWYIDIPTIAPTIIILQVMGIGGILGTGWEKLSLLSNDMTKPLALTIDFYEYQVGLASTRPDWSFSTAVGLLQNIVGIILTLSTNFLSKKITGHSFL